MSTSLFDSNQTETFFTSGIPSDFCKPRSYKSCCSSEATRVAETEETSYLQNLLVWLRLS